MGAMAIDTVYCDCMMGGVTVCGGAYGDGGVGVVQGGEEITEIQWRESSSIVYGWNDLSRDFMRTCRLHGNIDLVIEQGSTDRGLLWGYEDHILTVFVLQYQYYEHIGIHMVTLCSERYDTTSAVRYLASESEWYWSVDQICVSRDMRRSTSSRTVGTEERCFQRRCRVCLSIEEGTDEVVDTG
ncbi:hypothetical protein Tco_0009789 [Tanacetum coccineum]